MDSSLSKIVPKPLALREEDYWIIFVSIFTEIFIAASLYASVLTFRVPVIVLALAGLILTTLKVKKGYGLAHSRLHLATCLLLGFLLFIVVHILTN